MRNSIKIIFTAIILISLLLMCKKNDQDIIYDIDKSIPENSKAFKEYFAKNLDELKQEFTVDLCQPGTITTIRGVKINYGYWNMPNSNNCNTGGNTTYKIVIYEIIDKVDMLLTNMTTDYKDANGNHNFLISGGEYRIELYDMNGNVVQPNSNFDVDIPFLPNQDYNQMSIFDGIIDDDSSNVWTNQDTTTQIVTIFPNDTFSFYNCYNFPTFTWTNCDYFYSYTGAKTYFDCKVPDLFNNTNSQLFIAFKNYNVLSSIYNYDPNTHVFNIPYQIPIGAEVYFIFISIEGTNAHYKVQSSTIVNNHHEVISTYSTIPLSQLASVLNGLIL